MVGVPPVAPNGSIASTPIEIPVELTDDVNLNIDFGYLPNPAALNGTAWIDADNDNVIDADEILLSGVTVTLLNEDGSIYGITVTDENGFYSFANLLPGTYTVNMPQSIISPNGETGVVVLSGNDLTTTLDVGETQTGLDFPYVQTGSISDVVFLDLDGDGEMDENEQGVQGIIIILFGDNGLPVDTVETDENGFFEFPELPSGTYTIEVDPESVPEDLEFTTPDSVTYELEEGEVINEQDFGLDVVNVNGIIEVCTPVFTAIDLCVDLAEGEEIIIDATHSIFDCNITASAAANCITYQPFPCLLYTSDAADE